MVPKASFGSEKLHCDLASNKKRKTELNVILMISLVTEELLSLNKNVRVIAK